MKLSLYLCTSFLVLIQYYGKSLQFNAEDTCPTSRRLLLFGGFQFPLGEKKSEPVSSPSLTKQSRKIRKDEHTGLTIYIQPQTSSELGHKVRSFSHLLKPKLEKKKNLEKPKKKKEKKEKKKPKKIETPKTRDLITVNDQELDRCRALLHLEPSNSLVPLKEKEKEKEKPKDKKTKTKTKEKTKEKKKPKEIPTPVEPKVKKPVKPVAVEKKKSSEKPSVPHPPPKINGEKKSNPSGAASASSPPPTSSSTASSQRQSVPIQNEPAGDELDHDNDENDAENNGTVVGRAYHFMKSMFQLSDDILESNESETLNPTVDQTRSSRKLLSFDHLSHVSSRHLLSVKNTKKGATKPKVGWEYRYRISKYLADQKSRQKRSGGGKSKGKINLSKRKLLEVDADQQALTSDDDDDDDIVPMSVSITETFVPKRQLLSAKSSKAAKIVVKTHGEEKDDDDDDADDDDQEKVSRRRQMKSYEELTDPVAIVQSYDRGLFKPRVGWQFRYRVSRYIDSLRENIREDQERLKLGLEAIKRKTPQELSGRRKRVLDKPFQPESETPAVVEENKPSVGWRYRYRISKMMEAKARGEYVDEQEMKRKAKVDQKKKGGRDDDDECVEWEFEPDPELRKIGEEGRKVGWDYRYRIRRKLDHLKQRQAETGIPFDWETLGSGGKREKKSSTTATFSATTTTAEGEGEKVGETQKKSVGWQYRYRVSKMLEAQKQQAAEQSKKKKSDSVPVDSRLDPELAKLTPEQRVVGWAYRYRIRRKLEAIANATKEANAGKRKKKIIKKVEESIEKILNIDDIDETPFMEYFRRTSSYILFGLVPTAKKSVCLLPLPVTFRFCNEDDDESSETSSTTTTTTSAPTASMKTSTKREKVKKDKRPASTRSSKTEPVVTSTPTATPTVIKKVKKPTMTTITNTVRRPASAGNSRRFSNEQVKHFDEEEEPIKRRIGVPSMKHKTKKQYQIIGQEVKQKLKPPTTTTTTPAIPVEQTTTTTTTAPPPVTTTTTTTTTARPPPPPVVKTTTPPPPPPPVIPEEEASTVLSSIETTIDETKEEANENAAEQPVAAATPVNNDDDDESETDDSETDDQSGSDDQSDDDSKEEEDEDDDEQSKENFDPLALKKMKKLLQTAKNTMHGVFDFDEDEKASS